MSIISFEGDLDAFAKQVKLDYAKVVKRVAFDIFTRIVRKTPVDTGRARASWNLSIGTIDLTVAPEGQYPEMNTWDGEAKANAALATVTEKALLNDAIFITNNLPYIKELENGHSQQAPAGMVALSVLEVELKMKSLTKVPD
ncbi:MAG: HK97 gp10 family phage protein [Nitrospira sp.]